MSINIYYWHKAIIFNIITRPITKKCPETLSVIFPDRIFSMLFYVVSLTGISVKICKGKDEKSCIDTKDKI